MWAAGTNRTYAETHTGMEFYGGEVLAIGMAGSILAARLRLQHACDASLSAKR